MRWLEGAVNSSLGNTLKGKSWSGADGVKKVLLLEFDLVM